MKNKFKSIIALVLCFAMMFPLTATAFAADYTPEAIVTVDNDIIRETVCAGIVARYNKADCTMTITYPGGTTNTFVVTDDAYLENAIMTADAVTELQSKSVYLHAYARRVTDDNRFFWSIDIPSFKFNPADWCGELLVWEDDTIASYCEDFGDSIDKADESNKLLLASGIVGIAAIALGIITGPGAATTVTAAKAAFIAALKAVGIVADAGIIAAFVGVWSNLSDARDDYYAVKRYFERKKVQSL